MRRVKLHNVRLFSHRFSVNCRTYCSKYFFLSISNKLIEELSSEWLVDKSPVN